MEKKVYMAHRRYNQKNSKDRKRKKNKKKKSHIFDDQNHTNTQTGVFDSGKCTTKALR